MSQQNFRNHKRYYVPHHFIFYPLLGVFMSYCFYKGFRSDNELWFALGTGLFFIGWLSFMLRQHYSLSNQDRIIRVEVRLKYFELTGKRFELIEDKLSFKQIAALRFADGEEFIGLVQQAISGHMSSSQIKQSIQNWVKDDMRV